MSTATDEPLRVLRFWRDLEIFNIPTAPSDKSNTVQTQVTTWRRDAPDATLPWYRSEYAPTQRHTFVHTVYVGVADKEDLARLTLHALRSDEALSEREIQRLNGWGWLAAFGVNAQGLPKPDSYLAASFAHGVDALRRTGSLSNINARLQRAQQEFAQRCHRAMPIDTPSEAGPAFGSESLTWNTLDTERKVVCALLGDHAQAAALDWRVIVCSRRVSRRYLREDDLESGSDFLNSFFLNDLDRLIDQATRQQPFGAALRQYLGSAIAPEERVDVLTAHDAMTQLASVARLPIAHLDWHTAAHPSTLRRSYV